MDLTYEGSATAGDIRAQVYSWDSFACAPCSCRIVLSRLAARRLIERIEDTRLDGGRWSPVPNSPMAQSVPQHRRASQLQLTRKTYTPTKSAPIARD